MQLRKEIKFETLHKSHKKKIIIGVVVLCIIGSVLVFKTTRAKYRFTQSIPFVRGVINYKPSDLNVVAMYQENSAGNGWDSIDVAPSSGYQLNTTESRCEVNGTKDSSISIEFAGGKVFISNLTKKGTKCYMYFSKIRDNVLLAKYTKAGARSNYQTLTSDNSGKVYSLEDDDGTSYYFAGKVNNNWVKFAGFYWRIVRFNGDKSVRLIYSGTTAATAGTGTQIGISAFNSGAGNNMYVGYRYTDRNVHGTGTTSTIQEKIDIWYKTNIVDKGYEGKVESKAGFCGDRGSNTSSTGAPNGTGGTGTTTTYYAARYRFFDGSNWSWRTSPTPTYKCADSRDLYTVNGAKKGNESLTYPVGLITADEVGAAGGIVGTTNSSYYLYTNSTYWTMSPYLFNGSYPYVFRVDSDGQLNGDVNPNSAVDNTSTGVRPVLNLRADTTFKAGGNGTSTFPYEVA